MAELEEDPRNFTAPPPGKFFYAGWIIAVVLIMVATAGLVLARELWIGRQTSELERQHEAGPHVLVKNVTRSPATREIKLPATIRGFDETEVYAKVSGYLKKINVDKGDRVRKGQVIAILESPELDQQVANARANYNLARITDQRNQTLRKEGVVAPQMADEAHAQMLQAKAILEQDLANQAYKIITAPFDGIITARNIDPGRLVPASTSGAGGGNIVTIARSKPVRVLTSAPQAVSPFIKDGDQATITVAEYPARKFSGTITRHPDALSPDTRTMLVEVDLPNDDLALYPGMYARAQFTVTMGAGAPMVPDDALVFRDGKVFVPVVRNNQLHLAEVTLGYDNGQMVEVTSGINETDKVAVNVGQAARNGEHVQPVESPVVK
ncbi:MAG: efflux RND transporter periplasmic adaptor subunit [Candidatus Binatus sp.]|uniref:efflux RND transporter periplasmic adaptor subunit n=1 Tax=Candidatus Binatus sp. TaxID=2811406 RepID=UPI002724D7DB|nr:efflux RND transporter periplasmic adaptor subunit [Candidatus Binatus sp.]MDO8431651.1 efflux RND transporter periplasmic adaptor subunit [Candidatus Binatus sp.]